jgi:hypothetical protein
MGPERMEQDLTLIRRFRDEYLVGVDDWEVTQYYWESESLAERIAKSCEDGAHTYQELYDSFIYPTVQAISSDDMSTAHGILQNYLQFVRSF